MSTQPQKVVNADGDMVQEGVFAPALVLDLDGTVRRSKSDPEGFIEGPEDVALFGGVEEILREYREDGWLLLGASNQGGVAYGYKTPSEYNAELDAMINAFEGENPFHIIKACYHHSGGHVVPYHCRSLLRKPGYGMLALMEVEAFEAGYLIDWDGSLMVGDRDEDQACADAAGIDFAWANDFFERG